MKQHLEDIFIATGPNGEDISAYSPDGDDNAKPVKDRLIAANYTEAEADALIEKNGNRQASGEL